VLGGYILKFINTLWFFCKIINWKKNKKYIYIYISDFKITGFGYFRTLEEELVVLMKRIGSCKYCYLIFQNVWQWHICIIRKPVLWFLRITIMNSKNHPDNRWCLFLIFLITAQNWCTLLLYLLLTPPCSRNNKSLT
jgi:hypothetical protein